MLSIFPSLYQYEMFAPLLLRVVLALVFIHWAYVGYKGQQSSSREKSLTVVEGLAGILLFIGLWTQVATLFIIIDLIIRIIGKIKDRALLTNGINYYLILIVIAISILFLGAGVLAFDMPI